MEHNRRPKKDFFKKDKIDGITDVSEHFEMRVEYLTEVWVNWCYLHGRINKLKKKYKTIISSKENKKLGYLGGSVG